MTTPSFVHLRARTEYSIVQSTFRLDQMIDMAEADGQGAIAMTDIDSMFGALRFYNAARARGIKPILGADVALKMPGSDLSPRVLLIAQSYDGYLRLMRLLSMGHQRLGGDAETVIHLPWMLSETTDGLACLSGAREGLGAMFAQEDSAEGCLWADALAGAFPGRLFFEIQRPGWPDDDAILRATLSEGARRAIPVCATHPIQFAAKSDYLAHELRVCDKRGFILHDRNRPRPFTPHQHFLTQAQMGELFADAPEALANSLALALSCNAVVPLGKSVLPDFPVPEGMNLAQALATLSEEGLDARLLKSHPQQESRQQALPQYRERLAMELGIISSMGFDGYFMIVQDFIGWAKANNIPVGPGRGSGAGSLVAYVLGITDLDPLQYNLLFERFLNPERVSMPDFDIDFCKTKREKVIEYVTLKYGAASVSGISNINTLQAKAAIKAAGRALGMRVPFVDSVSKLIPVAPGKDVSISSALQDEPLLRARESQEPDVRRLLSMAKSLEGLPTAIGQHAAGLVISPTIISDYAPLYLPEGKAQAVTQYDKDDVEKAGLVKFDFLGLKTLTEIQLAVDFVRADPAFAHFEIADIPLDDPNVYAVFQRGDTHCIFQFESPGMQRLLIEASPSCFGDLVALNALYRPGPMDLIPDFILRKSGAQAVSYVDGRLEPILAETYGIMVYQEQVMQIAQVIGGYTLGGADLLRRAMGKKKAEEMAKHRALFVSGAEVKGVSAEDSGGLYDMMEKFAGYGFNKSHAAAYTLLAYQTAYLKHYHPAAFYAAWLSTESEEDTAIIPALIKDARKHGIAIGAPDVNASHEQFCIDGKDLRYGFSGLKGLGLEAARAVVSEREARGPYASMRDLVSRLGSQANKKMLDTLVKSGALDSLHPNRAESLAAIAGELKHRKEMAKYAEKLAAVVAELLLPSPRKKKEPTAPAAPEWPSLPEQPLLTMLSGERDSFGFFFSKHPHEHYRSELGGLKSCESLSSIAERPIDWDQHLIAGVVSECRFIDTKSGKLLIALIGDGDAEVEVKAFASVANRLLEWLKKDMFALMAVNLREDRMRGGKSIQITDARPLSEAKVLLADSIHVRLHPQDLPSLLELCEAHPGSMPVYAWHPADGALARSSKPYALVAQTQPCFDEFARRYAEHCAIGYKEGKPPALSSR